MSVENKIIIGHAISWINLKPSMISERSQAQSTVILSVWRARPGKTVLCYWNQNSGDLMGGVGIGGMVTGKCPEGTF